MASCWSKVIVVTLPCASLYTVSIKTLTLAPFTHPTYLIGGVVGQLCAELLKAGKMLAAMTSEDSSRTAKFILFIDLTPSLCPPRSRASLRSSVPDSPDRYVDRMTTSRDN